MMCVSYQWVAVMDLEAAAHNEARKASGDLTAVNVNENKIWHKLRQVKLTNCWVIPSDYKSASCLETTRNLQRVNENEVQSKLRQVKLKQNKLCYNCYEQWYNTE